MGGCMSTNDGVNHPSSSPVHASSALNKTFTPHFEHLDVESPPGAIAIFGSYDSGKSTLLRKLWMLYGESYTAEERLGNRHIIDATILHGIFSLLQAFFEMYPPVTPQSLGLAEDGSPLNSFVTPKKVPRELHNPNTHDLSHSPQMGPKDNMLSEDQLAQLNNELSQGNLGNLEDDLFQLHREQLNGHNESPPLAHRSMNASPGLNGRQGRYNQEISRSSDSHQNPVFTIINNNNNSVSTIHLEYLRSYPTLLTTYPHLTPELLESLLFFITLDIPHISLYPIKSDASIKPNLSQQSSLPTGNPLLAGLPTYGQISSVLPPYLLFSKTPINSTIARHIQTIWDNTVIKFIYHTNHALFQNHPYHNQMFRVNNNNNTLVMFCEGYIRRLAAHPEYDQRLGQENTSYTFEGDDFAQLISDVDVLLMKYPHVLPNADQQTSNLQQQQQQLQPQQLQQSNPNGNFDDSSLETTTKTIDTLLPFVQYKFDSTGFLTLLHQQEEKIKKDEQDYFQSIRRASITTPYSSQRQLDIKALTEQLGKCNSSNHNDGGPSQGNLMGLVKSNDNNNSNNNGTLTITTTAAVSNKDLERNIHDNGLATFSEGDDLSATLAPTNCLSLVAENIVKSHSTISTNSNDEQIAQNALAIRSFSTLGPEHYLPETLYALDAINQPPAPLPQHTTKPHVAIDLEQNPLLCTPTNNGNGNINITLVSATPHQSPFVHININPSANLLAPTAASRHLSGTSLVDEDQFVLIEHQSSIRNSSNNNNGITVANINTKSTADGIQCTTPPTHGSSLSFQASAATPRANKSGTFNPVPANPNNNTTTNHHNNKTINTPHRVLRPSNVQTQSSALLKQPVLFGGIAQSTPTATNTANLNNTHDTQPQTPSTDLINGGGNLNTLRKTRNAHTTTNKTTLKPKKQKTIDEHLLLSIFDTSGHPKSIPSWPLVMHKHVKLMYYVISLAELLNVPSLDHKDYGFYQEPAANQNRARSQSRGRAMSFGELESGASNGVNQSPLAQRLQGFSGLQTPMASFDSSISASTKDGEPNNSNTTKSSYQLRAAEINKHLRKNILLMTKTVNSYILNSDSEIIIVFSKYDILVKHLLQQKALYYNCMLNQLEQGNLILFKDIFNNYTGDNFDPHEITTFLVQQYTNKLHIQNKNVFVSVPQSGLVYLNSVNSANAGAEPATASATSTGTGFDVNDRVFLISNSHTQGTNHPTQRKSSVYTFGMENNNNSNVNNSPNVASSNELNDNIFTPAPSSPSTDSELTTEEIYIKEIKLRDETDCTMLYLQPISRLVEKNIEAHNNYLKYAESIKQHNAEQLRLQKEYEGTK